MESKEKWQKIWEKRSIKSGDNVDLADLIAIDGFDSGAGKHSVQTWLSLVKSVEDKIGIKSGHAVCEIGCGAGAFLYPLKSTGARLHGIDYASNLVKVCKSVLPDGVFLHAEANNIPFDTEMFDSVFSHSVFQYLPGLDYASQTIAELARILKVGGKAALLDVNDAEKEGDYMRIRGAKIGIEKYKEKYKDTPHQFYHKKWIQEVAKANNLSCYIENQNLEDYGNSQFRFNVFLEKLAK